jgi:uncharacterized protein
MALHLTLIFRAGTKRRMPLNALLLAFVALISASLTQAQAPTQYKPQGYVNDFANVLSPAARQQLTALCTEVDQKAHAQIAVVAVPSTNGQPIQDYSFDLATKWGIGPKQSNRGVLILFAINDHKYWIQVGYGLEPILPDGKVGGFGREAVPILREGNYDAAALLITRRIADVIAQDAGVTLSGIPPSQLRQRQDRTRLHPGPLVLLLLVIMIIVALMVRGGGSGGGSGNSWWLAPFIAANMNRGRWGGGGFGGSSWGGGGDSGGGGGGFGGFGGGDFGGGGAGGSW